MSLKRALGLAVFTAAFWIATPAANAQTADVTANVTKHGVDVGDFTGEFALEKFQVRKGVLYAIGTLSGTIDRTDGAKDRVIKGTRIALPVDLEESGISEGAVAAAADEDGDIEASALDVNVLTLVLGPLDLNLLGLEIHLNQVVLTIDADPTGGLLGALLAALAGFNLGDLLGFLGNLGDLADFLNLILDLLG
jgi:hypothetical protein